MIMISQNGFAISIVSIYLIIKVLRLANFREINWISDLRVKLRGLMLGKSATVDVKSGEYKYFVGEDEFDVYNGDEKVSLKENYLFNEIIYTSFMVYLIFLVSKIYFPMTIAFGEEVVHRMPSIWLRPLWSLGQVYNMGGIDSLIYQIGGNLILLTPLAFYMMYFRGDKFKTLKDVLMLCLQVTICIECSQVMLSLLIPNVQRFFEINDIICNTLSGIWGYWIYKALNFLLAKYGVYESKKQKVG